MKIGENDLISRAAAKEAIRKKFPNVSDRCEINEVLNSIPAVGAVLVVMCRDCKYWEMPRTAYGIKCGYCNNMHSHVSSHRMPEENYYCPRGERRESE